MWPTLTAIVDNVNVKTKQVCPIGRLYFVLLCVSAVVFGIMNYHIKTSPIDRVIPNDYLEGNACMQFLI